MLRFDKLTPTAIILVVEDAKNVRDSVQQVIEEMGFRVEAAATEDEAVELAKRHRAALIVEEPDRPPTSFSGGHGIRVWYPRGADPSWRNECFGYTGNREWLKGLLRHWLEDERPGTHPWWTQWKW